MNRTHCRFAAAALAAAALLVLAPAPPLSAQSPPAAKSSAAKPQQQGRKRVPRPVAQAQAVIGKPLTDAQRKAVLTAAKERDKAMKPIRDRYRAKVAKALGMSVAQLDAKEKTLRNRRAQRSGGGMGGVR